MQIRLRQIRRARQTSSKAVLTAYTQPKSFKKMVGGDRMKFEPVVRRSGQAECCQWSAT
jgi:hypothetical protein